MKILIIVAMESELEGFLSKKEFEVKLISGITTYVTKSNENEIYISKCEVGKVNASSLTTFLILKLKPRFIINAGIAGALNESLNVFDTIFATKCAYHDFDLTAFGLKKGELDNHPAYFKTSTKLLSLAPTNVKKGLIVSGDQFISSKEQLSDIKANFPKALACDMEGCSIVHTSEIFKRKSIVIRTISDNAFKTNQVDDYVDNKKEAIDIVANITLDLIDKL